MHSEEISPLALKYMQDFSVSPVPHSVFLVEDEAKDSPMDFKSYYEANRAWDNLLALELVTDKQRGVWVDHLTVKTGREFRMFTLTEYGKLFIEPKYWAWIN